MKHFKGKKGAQSFSKDSTGPELIALAARLAELALSENRYRIAAENSSEIIMEYNAMEDSIFFATDRVENVYGVPQRIESGRDYLVRSGVVQPESEYAFLEMFQRVRDGAPRVQCTVKMRTIEGEFRWTQIILSTLFNAQNQPERAIGVMKDITQQREVELQYESELLYRDAMQRDALLIYEMDLTNRKMLSGMEAQLSALGLPFTDDYDTVIRVLISCLVYVDDREMMSVMLAADRLLDEYAHGNSKVQLEYRKLGEDGEPFWASGTIYITDDKLDDSVRAFYYVHDINDAKLEELRLRDNAERDLLTGLYNKGTTEQLVMRAIAAPLPEGRISAFFIVDLDNFKNINDQLGHAFGDAVLSETAQKLQGICRSDDVAGRIGGDEFVLFFKNLPDHNMVEAKARRICEMFHDSYSGVLGDYKVSGTVGVSILPTHADTFEELYRKADLALYSAKNRGKDSFCVFSDDLADFDCSGMHRAHIDRSSDKTFSENVIEYVFHILYDSQDLQRAILGILELVTKHFHFSRGYIYEYTKADNCFTCAFEWCAHGTESLTELQPILSGRLMEISRHRFIEERFSVLSSPEAFEPEERALPSLQSVYSRIQYSLVGNGYFHGFVGFDRCSDAPLDLSRLSVLQGVAQLLDTFLSEKYSSEDQARTRSMLQAMTDSMYTCTYIIDPTTHVLQFANRSTQERIPAAKPGCLCYVTIRGRTEPCPDCPIKLLSETKRSYHTEMYLDPYGLWAKINVSLVTLSDQKDYGLFTGYDFTRYKDSGGAYIVNADAFTRDVTLYDALSHSTDDYLYMCDMAKDLFYFPQAMVEEFGLPSQIVEQAVPLWSTYIHPHERAAFLRDMEDMLNGKSATHSQEYRARNKEGHWVWLRSRGYLQRDEAGKPSLFAGVITNLEKKRVIDPLSGLPNKYEFERRFRKALAKKTGGWLLLLGLDNFKNINSLYGWEFGDRVMHAAAQLMQFLLPDYLQIYRLDGDKFGIFCLNDNGPGANAVYQSIFSAFQSQQQYEGRRYYCTISGGYTTFPPDALSFTPLLRQAEFALDYSKSEGKNRLGLYNETLMGNKDRLLTLIERLRESVDHGCMNFELYYQPQVDAHTQELRGAEALLRWRCQEYGHISPAEFIPLLEQTGLIHAVGRWVLENAAKTSRAWRRVRPDFTLNINLSFAQLQDNTFLPYLSRLIEEDILDSSAIHLELTESCLAAGSTSLAEAFRGLRGLGFCIEMDDFGTGYSSLAILKNAPADVVKIDRAFVADIAKSNFDATFIQFVVALCHSVDIKVCLEGVETWEEYHMVEQMSVDLIQGYLFGKPQSYADFEANFIKLQ